jgi:hypothetical protein
VPEEGRTREKKLLDTNRRFTEVLLWNWKDSFPAHQKIELNFSASTPLFGQSLDFSDRATFSGKAYHSVPAKPDLQLLIKGLIAFTPDNLVTLACDGF